MLKDQIKIAIKKVKNATPVTTRKRIKDALKDIRKVRNKVFQKYFGRSVTKQEIIEGLTDLGIEKGDIVFVHSSLSRIGMVDGGSETILQALFDVVGREGTVGAPTFWGLTRNYLAGNTTYDVKNSKSILGSFTEIIRKHPESKRSLHPTHSAAFIGPKAEFLVKNHHHDKTPFGPNSPYRKLILEGGKILLFGVEVEYMTSLHTIEDSIENFPVKVYTSEPLIFNVVDENGNHHEVPAYLHCPEAAKLRNSLKLVPYFVKNKIFTKTQIGFGTVKIVNAETLHNTLTELYQNGITMYK